MIVSLNKKAKELGLKRGLNEYECAALLRKNKVAVMESNYELYNDISGRVMTTLAGFAEQIQIESIDEAFLCLDGYEMFGWNDYGRRIADTVKKNIGVPVSMGIAATKTLAKLANRFAKKFPRFNNTFVMDTEQKRIECLRRTNIGDVWGIGSELREKLMASKIFTALDFTTKISQSKARMLYNVELERTWCELQGIRCHAMETSLPDRKSLITSRIFPHPVKDKESLRQALATYSAICAADLRQQRSYAVSVGVYLETSRYHKNRPPYRLHTQARLPFPANTSLTIVNYALKALDELFIPGLEYKKRE